MRTVSVFLASSIVEMKRERSMIASKFLDWNDKFQDRGYARIKLIRAEGVDDSFRVGGKQSLLDDLLRQSDLAFFLFGSHAGDKTIGELQLAINCYDRYRKPRIYICFDRQSNPDESVANLKARLGDLYKNYYIEYGSIDELTSKMYQALVDHILDGTADAQPVPQCRTPVRIVDSQLAVVHAFIQGAQFEEVLPGYRIKYIPRPWSKDIFQYCESGRGDLCVANKNDLRSYLQENPTSKLANLGTVGFSMGGKNISLIVRRDSRLAGKSKEEVLEGIAGSTIVVGRHTDRFRGLLTVLGVDEDWLASSGVIIHDIPDPSVRIFDVLPEAIVVAGQNLRLEALETGDCTEILPFNSLEPAIRRKLTANSENVLVANTERLAENQIDGEEVYRRAKSNFSRLAANEAELDELVNVLLDDCSFETSDYDIRESLIRTMLFETYRLGQPVF